MEKYPDINEFDEDGNTILCYCLTSKKLLEYLIKERYEDNLFISLSVQ
jgi:hypothetical protein